MGEISGEVLVLFPHAPFIMAFSLGAVHLFVSSKRFAKMEKTYKIYVAVAIPFSLLMIDHFLPFAVSNVVFVALSLASGMAGTVGFVYKTAEKVGDTETPPKA